MTFHARLSFAQLGMTLLRMAIGWHFLYEGLWKLCVSGGWSAAPYLRMTRWVGADWFHALAENPQALQFCNFATMWGLIAIGLALLMGVCARLASVAAIVMLSFFYVAQPPFLTVGGAHHFLIFDYTLLEAVACLAIAFEPGCGVWSTAKILFFGAYPKVTKDDKAVADDKKAEDSTPATPDGIAASERDVEAPVRRQLLTGLAVFPVAAAFGAVYRSKHGWPTISTKDKKAAVEAETQASYRFKYQDIGDLKKRFDYQLNIGGVKMSRITLGGNLIGGWAHSRDLGYVSTLMKAYNTPRRIYDTMHLAEACGINAISTNPCLMNFITRYWKDEGGKIQFISDCGWADENGELGIVVGAKRSVDAGAALIYIHGFGADDWASKGDWKTMEYALKEMRKLGVPVGIGAHAFSTLKFCVEHDLIPDFWMKTFHPGGYWSAQKTPQDGGEGEPGSNKRGWNDNNWCRDPAALSAWFESRPEPWIAFKTMAAGAVHPRESIPFVFNGGADAACMGMFDFQVVEDVNLAQAAFERGFAQRKRAWIN